MKYLFFALLVLCSALPNISASVENEKADKVKKNFNALLDEMDHVLVKIRSGLLADKRYKELPQVEFDKLALTVVGRQALMQAVNFLYKNTQYWANDTDSVKDLSVNITDTPDYVLSVFLKVSEDLLKIENGTSKDHKVAANALAKVFGVAVRSEVVPSVKKFYTLLEKYHDYVNPSTLKSVKNASDNHFWDFLKPDRNATYAARNVTVALFTLGRNLAKVSTGLVKDRHFLEVPAVEFNRFTLSVPTLATLLQTVQLAFTNKQAWYAKDTANLFVIKNANDSKSVYAFLDGVKGVLTKIQNATEKKNKVANALSKVLIYSLDSATRPALVTYYELAEKYKKYLTPPKQDQLLSSFNLENKEESSDSETKFFDTLFDQLDNHLELVRKGLFEKQNFKDMGRVDLNRLMLKGVTRTNVRNAVKFALKYERFWRNKTENKDLEDKLKNLSESTEESVILQVLDTFANVFKVTADGLREENNFVEVVKAKVYENIVRKEVKQVVKSSLHLIEKYVVTEKPEDKPTTPEVLLSVTNESNQGEDLVNNVLDLLHTYLAVIEQHLIDDRKILEVGKIQFLKPRVNIEARLILNQSLKLALKHKKYWKEEEKKFAYLNESEDNMLTDIMNCLNVALGKIEQGLIKDKKFIELGKVKITRRLLVKTAKPIVDSTFEILKKYEKYLDNINQLISN